MKNYSTNEIRNLWLKFFSETKNHKIIEPAPLIPKNDDTLLWINSGVAAIKTYFDGSEKSPAPRLVNSQPSIRTNDIENVGRTARHHTLFEMLGNFSIGDYFKREAIHFAWEFLTDEKWLGFDSEKLYITVYQEDDFAYDIWHKEIKIPQEKIIKGDKSTNFWEIGQGPCGPNTEIFYDRGVDYDPENKGIKLLQDDIDNDRYLEVWNLVFSQFNNDGNGNYSDLPMQNIDTGMGLERTASLLQDAPTNYETDQFKLIIEDIEKETNIKFISERPNQHKFSQDDLETNMAFKAIADHIKCNVFSIADGAIFSNEKRGYVLRRLLRRAVNMGRRLGIKRPFLYKLVDGIVEYHKEFFPRLKKNKDHVIKLIKIEEEKFGDTVEKGYAKLNSIIKSENKMSPQDAFLLFNSYGFPIELTEEICLENNISVDLEAFDKLFEEHKTKAKSSYKATGTMAIQSQALSQLDVSSTFDYQLEETSSKVVGIIQKDKVVDKVSGTMLLAFDVTPFYATSGGQIDDQGTIGDMKVEALVKSPHKITLHQITSDKEIKIGDSFDLKIWDQRFNLRAHHSGSHLIHQVVKELFGAEANQSGKYVGNHRLRFDFTCSQKIPSDIASQIETLVNKKINENNDSIIKIMPYQQAIDKGAIALFTEKYLDDVRTVKIGGSFELCGGTHVSNSQEIEEFVLTSFESKGAGIYRIEGICTKKLVKEYNHKKNIELQNKYNTFKVKHHNKDYFVEFKIKDQSYRNNLKDFKSWKNHMAKGNRKWNKAITKEYFVKYSALQDNVVKINDFNVLSIFGDMPASTNRDLVAHYINKLQDLIVIVGSNFDQKSTLVVSVSKSYQDKISASDIVNSINKKTNMKGGGNQATAQSGGENISNLQECLENIEEFINV